MLIASLSPRDCYGNVGYPLSSSPPLIAHTSVILLVTGSQIIIRGCCKDVTDLSALPFMLLPANWPTCRHRYFTRPPPQFFSPSQFLILFIMSCTYPCSPPPSPLFCTISFSRTALVVFRITASSIAAAPAVLNHSGHLTCIE